MKNTDNNVTETTVAFNLEADTLALANWLTTGEVEEKTGMSWTQIQAMEKKGILIGVKKGGSTLWHASGLEKLAKYASLKAQIKEMEKALMGDAAE